MFASPAAAAGSAWQRASKLKPRAMNALRGIESVFSRRGGAFLCHEDVGAGAEHEGHRHFVLRDAGQGTMLKIDLYLIPALQPQGCGTPCRADLEKGVGRDQVSAERKA